MTRKPGIKRRAPLFASMLRAIALEAKTARAIATEVGITPNPSMNILRRLYGLRLIHIGGWSESGWGHPAAVLWKLGDGDDAPRPPGKRGAEVCVMQQRKHAGPLAPLELIAFATAVRALQEPTGARQLAELTGWHRSTTQRFLRHLQTIGLVYIADWSRERRQGAWTPMFQVGIDCADKAKPRPIPRSVIERKCWQGRAQRLRDMRIHQALAANGSSQGAALELIGQIREGLGTVPLLMGSCA